MCLEDVGLKASMYFKSCVLLECFVPLLMLSPLLLIEQSIIIKQYLFWKKLSVIF